MNKTLAVALLIFLSAAGLSAQQADTTRTDTTGAVSTQPPPPAERKVFYGGGLGLSFGDYFRLNVSPMIGFILSPKTHAGIRVMYEYTKDTRSSQEVTSHNFGGSVFARYRVIPQAYLHGEFQYMSYQYSSGDVSSTREWVPFLLLGGGVVQSIGKNTSAYAEVLFDVLQDPGSPYEDWAPMVSVGVAVGF